VTLSKRQKSVLALFAIALVALVIDRAFLGGSGSPSEASASSSPPPDTNNPQTSNPPDEESKPSTVRLDQKIEALWLEKDLDLQQPREIFTLPAPWLADILPKKPENTAMPKDAVTVFMTSHELQGVVISDQTRCVTVNDHILYLGDELDGFTLIAIAEDSATFEFDARRAVLKLERDR